MLSPECELYNGCHLSSPSVKLLSTSTEDRVCVCVRMCVFTEGKDHSYACVCMCGCFSTEGQKCLSICVVCVWVVCVWVVCVCVCGVYVCVSVLG